MKANARDSFVLVTALLIGSFVVIDSALAANFVVEKSTLRAYVDLSECS